MRSRHMSIESTSVYHQARFSTECKTCDKHFTRKNLLDQHLWTNKHRQVVAAAEAAEGTGSTSLVASVSLDKSSLNIISHNTTTNSTNVRIRPRSLGRANVDHMICLTYEVLREALTLPEDVVRFHDVAKQAHALFQAHSCALYHHAPL